MMCMRLGLVDLPEDGSRVIDRIHIPPKKPAPPTPYLLGKGELRSRENTNCRAGIFRRREPASARIEVVGGQFVANLSGTRLNVVQAVIAHAEDLLCCPQPQPTKSKNCTRGLMLPTAPASGHGGVVKSWQQPRDHL